MSFAGGAMLANLTSVILLIAGDNPIKTLMPSNHRGRTRIRGVAMWLLLLELRTPLITLIITYSISVLGLVLIPGMTLRRDRLSSVLSRCVLRGELYRNDHWLW